MPAGVIENDPWLGAVAKQKSAGVWDESSDDNILATAGPVNQPADQLGSDGARGEKTSESESEGEGESEEDSDNER